ncbi:hypothetical protein [Natrinema caseinilyticum]|uniref:hypothetical protein n=1 Tax=Natrinema caseinilyticum TaxID=2961570 RepID=UPI0020C4E281|nr:hypothetical protein [Natrinema caseinilyticum]
MNTRFGAARGTRVDDWNGSGSDQTHRETVIEAGIVARNVSELDLDVAGGNLNRCPIHGTGGPGGQIRSDHGRVREVLKR